MWVYLCLYIGLYKIFRIFLAFRFFLMGLAKLIMNTIKQMRRLVTNKFVFYQVALHLPPLFCCLSTENKLWFAPKLILINLSSTCPSPKLPASSKEMLLAEKPYCFVLYKIIIFHKKILKSSKLWKSSLPQALCQVNKIAKRSITQARWITHTSNCSL